MFDSMLCYSPHLLDYFLFSIILISSLFLPHDNCDFLYIVFRVEKPLKTIHSINCHIPMGNARNYETNIMSYRVR